MTCRTKSGLLDLVTRVVCDHSSDLILLRVCPKNYDWSRWRCRLEDCPKDSLKDYDWSRRRCWLEDRRKDSLKDPDWLRRRCRLGDRPKDAPKDSDWSRRRCRLGDRPKDAPKDSDWSRRSNLTIWRCVRLVVLPDRYDWTRRETCLFFLDATDWTVRWTCLARTLLIGWSADLLQASSFGFFVARFQTAKRDWRENDYEKASSLGDKYAVLICSWRQNRQNKRHLVLLTLPVLYYIYCALCQWCGSVSVCVCRWVVLNSTCSEYYN